MGGVAVAEVFVSHAGRDRAWAEWVAWQLQQAGWSVELDYWDWCAGENVVARMSVALGSCTAMVALFSEAYFEPMRWTSEEWTAALVLAKDNPTRLVPVRIDDSPVPDILRPLIAPALFGLSAVDARAELLRAVRGPARPEREPEFPGSVASGEFGTDTGQAGPRLPGVLPQVWGGIPARNLAFTGRDAMLVALRDGLVAGGRSVVQALQGMGGVGKTQLASEYVWRFANEYDAVWWVDAEQTDLIGEQLAAFAAAWGLVERGARIGPAVEALLARCRTRPRWLLVLDNARSQGAVRAWVPAGPGHVVLTSRDPRPWQIAAQIEVQAFTRSESVALLRAQVPTLTETDADRLADALGDLPLAVAQAAGMIAETGTPAHEYLQLLDESAADLLSEGTPGSYPLPLAATIRVSVDQLANEDQAAAHLLAVCAFLAPEPIPTRLFTTTPADVLPDPLGTVAAHTLAFRRCVGRLGRYGLARVAESRLQLHRLTQAIVRDSLPPAQRTDHATVAEAVLAALDPGNPADPVCWPGWAELLPHLRAVDLANTDNPTLRRQSNAALWYLRCRGKTHTGHQLALQLYQAWSARLGADDGDTLAAANQLASFWRDLDHHQQAHELDQDSLERERRLRGPDHPETLRSANGVAADLRALGHYEAARDVDEDTLARRRRVLGDDHPDTLRSANNLARDLRALGRHEAARDIDDDTLDRRRRLLGDDHPDTLTSVHNLANDLGAMGRHEAARDLEEDTLARRRRILGEDHPHTVATAHTLAANLRALGQHQAARDLEEDTHQRRG